MKRKLLLSALALPAVFAACTQEDVMEQSNGNVQKRIALENVTFEFAPESRYAFEGGFNNYTPKKDDAVGAYLFDTPDNIRSDEDLASLRATAETDWDIENGLLAGYTQTDYIQGAFKWVYDGSKFETLDQMVEGQYIYVAPYQNKKTREAITTEIPQLMQLKYKEGTTELNENSLLDALAESGTPVAVGYEFLSRYDEKVNGMLKQIYAYPRITFDNVLEETVTVQKVVISSGNKIALKGTLDLKKAATELKKYDSDSEGTQNGAWINAVSGNYYQSEDGNYTADIVTPIEASKVDFVVVMAPADFKVAAGKSMGFQAVLPAAAYTNLTIDVYTDKGVFRAVASEANYDNGLRYSAANYGNGSLRTDLEDNENTLKDESEHGYDVAVAEETAATLKAVVVVNTADLINVINGEAEGTVAKPADINVIPMSDVKIDSNVITALGDKKALTVTQDIEIEGTESGLVVKNVDFGENTAIVTEGSVTFQNATLASLEVKEGASVEVTNGFSENVNVLNKGTLKINNKLPISGGYQLCTTKMGTVVNLGVLNIETKLEATAVYNGTTAAVTYADVVTNAKINAGANIESTVNNYAELNIDKSISIKNLQNNEVASGSNVKEGTVSVAGNVMLQTAGANYGHMEIDGEFRAVDAFANYGTIDNNYGMENVAGVLLDNNEGGYITVSADAKYTSVNTNEGIIEILNRESEIHADVNPGTILYTAGTGSSFVVLATDKYNTVKFNEGKTLDAETEGDGYKDGAVEKANALTVIANATGNYAFKQKIKGFEVSAGKYATTTSDVTISGSVDIKSLATLHLGTNTVMKFNKSEGFVNAGTFRNMGKMYAMCYQPEGVFVGSGNYYWGCANSTGTSALQYRLNEANDGDVVVLEEDLILDQALTVTKSVVIDLNGKTLTMDCSKVEEGKASAGIIVNGNVNVTIAGGTVDMSYDWTGDQVSSSGKNKSVYAVYAMNGTINIKSGTFITGSDRMEAYGQNGQLAGTPVIGLGENATANISGGGFEAKYPISEGTGDYVYMPLRLTKGTWNVTGGTYANYNPSAAIDLTAAGGNDDVKAVTSNGYSTVKVINAMTGKDETSSMAKKQFNYDWAQGRYYTVGLAD